MLSYKSLSDSVYTVRISVVKKLLGILFIIFFLKTATMHAQKHSLKWFH